MNCPNCGSVMSPSKISWLCLDCGHIEQNTEAMTAELGKPSPAETPETESPPPGPVQDAPSTADVVPPSDPASLSPETPEQASSLASPGVTPETPQAMPTVASSVAASPSPSVAPSPAGTDSSVAPDLDQSRRKPLMIGGIALLVVLLLGGVGLKLFVYDPQNAPVAYFKKVAAAKTGTVKASINYHSENEGSDIFGIGKSATLGINGGYDVSDEKTAKADLKLNFKAGQVEIGGHIISLPKTLYFQLSSAGFLSSFGVSGGNQWYKFPVDQKEDKTCDKPKSKKAGNYFGAVLPSQVPVTKARRVGLYEQVAGHTTSHYIGTIDFQKLQKVVDAANKDLSADCKIDFNKNDYKDYLVSYDLWTSGSFDRMALKIQSTSKSNKITITATIDSSGYDKPVKIEAPKGAKDFSLLSGLGESTSMGLDAGSDPATPTGRDSQRKNTVHAVSAYLEMSAGNNRGMYPGAAGGESLASFNSQYLNEDASDPKDPLTNTAYVLPSPSGGISVCPSGLKPGALSYALAGRKYQVCIGLEAGGAESVRN